jgi:uncharacterized FAD-dependent dehydrogenase
MPIVIGFGPAGMFAALELIERGQKPVIFERGKSIEERSVDVKKFITERLLNSGSNVQFGEGGAGSYSDGKLFSRPGNNNPYVQKVLETFVKFGAPPEITHMKKPHLGTDVLCKIVRDIREYVLRNGGEIHHNAKMTDLLITHGKIAGVVINNDKEHLSSSVFLAIGHSARDTFELLKAKGVALEQRAISIGVRLEHPAATIDRIRQGVPTYSFNYTDRAAKRGVYTFCMCPGGEIVNASSEEGMLVLNGMSYAARSSQFSNAAIIVSCQEEDYGSSDALAGIEFQRAIERKAFTAGGGKWSAPAQNLEDYLSGRVSARLNSNSFKMGVVPADLREIFPPFVNEALLAAFSKWRREEPAFVSGDAILLAAETRPSCPLRIKRGAGYVSENIAGLYPVGEGSGYTGGITSSAADAIKAVECCLAAGC